MRPRPAIVLLTLLALAPAALATEVYVWTDASGVKHYSDSPPAGVKYTTRSLETADPVVESKPGSGDDALPLNADDRNCAQAKKNLSLLQSSQRVASSGNNKAEMTAPERKRQTELAQAAINTYCSKP
jgi:hypothetical protein